jgi:uncharacterized membrane protein YdjX (TVP38/TMEM64 family)
MLIGRFFGGAQLNNHLTGRAKRLDMLIEERGYLPIMYMRLFSIPSTIINYSIGTTKLAPSQMALGSFIGATPRAITFVVVGGKLDDLTHPAVILSVILWSCAMGYGFYKGRGMINKIQTAWCGDANDQGNNDDEKS